MAQSTFKFAPPIPYSFDELYISDTAVKQYIKERTLNADILEVGPGPLLGFIITISDAKSRTIIEPLADKYALLRDELNIHFDGEESITTFCESAENHISQLNASMDMVICNNALDHTPGWMFALSEMITYLRKNGLFYLATDIDHLSPQVDGHYQITYNPNKLYRLCENLGLKLLFTEVFTMALNGATRVSIVGQKY